MPRNIHLTFIYNKASDILAGFITILQVEGTFPSFPCAGYEQVAKFWPAECERKWTFQDSS